MAKMTITLTGAIFVLVAGASAWDWGKGPGDLFSGYGQEFRGHQSYRPMLSNLDETDDSTGYDVVHYNIEIQFFPLTHAVIGKVDMRFVVVGISLATVNLNLRNNMIVDSAKINGSMVSHQFQGLDGLSLNLSQTLAQGDSATATVWYHGFPIAGNMGALFWELQPGTSIPLISSLSEPEGARTWWPCKDIPSDKATARMQWKVPEDLFATSNGLLHIMAWGFGWTTYEWIENYPLPPYLISIAATDYIHLQDWYVTTLGDSLPLDNYVYLADSARALVAFQDLPEMMTYYASIFGEYPFMEEKYGHAAFNFGGAMEHQTLTSYGAWAIDSTQNNNWMMAHELSHQWWGDLVTCETWADIWLNEGFATYCDALWAYHDGGQAVFQQRMNYFRDERYFSIEPSEGRFPVYNPVVMWGVTVYEKSAWILHMLRWVMGETNFWNFWPVYREAYAPGGEPGNVNTAQMQETAELVAGQDLDWFFQEWIYMAGYPEYQWGWQITPQGDSTRVQLSLQQVQSTAYQTPEVFTMPVPVQVCRASDTLTWIVWNDQRLQEFDTLVAGFVTDVNFDPDNWILKTETEGLYVGVAPLLAVQPHTQALLMLAPNPTNASLVASYKLQAASFVRLQLYDIAGKLVETLAEGAELPGEYRIATDVSRLTSGMYLVRLEAGLERVTQKLVVVK